MELNPTSLAITAIAGVLSFVSPCVLSLLPAYLSYIVGESAADVAAGAVPVPRTSLNALAFVLGLATMFTLLGASVSLAGSLLLEYRSIVSKIAGALIIVFGIHTIGLVRLPFLYSEKRVDFAAFSGVRFARPYLIGAAFGIGWTPCIGPVLGSVLLLAGQADTVSQGAMLLFVYSLGLGVPFVVVALALRRAWLVLSWLKRHAHAVAVTSGSLLVVVGALVFTSRFALITTWLISIFGTGLTI